jgi:hypothetical protein
MYPLVSILSLAMVCGHNQYHALSATPPATERNWRRRIKKFSRSEIFQELRPEFSGMGSE